jgi:hypothetical protein
MESLSRAYIQAIAGKAGLNLKLEQNAQEFDYGVDGTFYSIKELRGKLVNSGFPLDFQAKASTDWRYDSAHVIYGLKVNAYNKIVDRNSEKGAIPQILILLCLPKDPRGWLESTEEQLLLRRCCYWERLVGKPTNNRGEITIRIPRTQHLVPTSLIDMLNKVKSGEWR